MRSELIEKSGTLIVFSFGAPHRLEAQLRESGANVQRIIWIDPLLDDAAVDKIDLGTPIKRIEAAVVSAGKTVELLGYSLPDLYSLTPASAALTSLLPGLRDGQATKVSAISAKSLSSSLKGLVGPVHVVIDAPGAEATLIDVLARRPLENAVDTVWMRCGEEAFFKKSLATNALIERLNGLGFEVGSIDDDDPDWPEITLTFDARAQKIKSLEAAKAKLGADQKKQRASLRAAQKEARDVSAALSALKQDHDAAVSDVAEQSKALDALRAELSVAQTDLEAAKNGAGQKATLLEQAQADLVAVAKERDALKTEVEKVTQALEDARRDVGTITKNRDEETVRANQNASVLKTTRAELESLKAEASASKGTLEKSVADMAAVRAELDGVAKERDDETVRANQNASVLKTTRAELEDVRANLTAAAQARDDAQALAAQNAEELTKSLSDVDARTKERDDAKVARAQQADVTAKLRADVKVLSARTVETERRAAHDMQQCQADLRRAVLAHERAQADADVLRTRLIAAEEDCQSLRRLLQQLTPRLREAAKYARDVTLDTDNNGLASLLDAPAKRPKKKKKKKRKTA